MPSCTGSNLVSRHTVQYQLWLLMHCSCDDAWPPWSAHPLLKATTEFKAIYIHTQPIKKITCINMWFTGMGYKLCMLKLSILSTTEFKYYTKMSCIYSLMFLET